MIKVLFAALKYDYGKLENGLSVEYTNFFDALKHMDGVEAEFFAIDEHSQKLGRDGANQLLLATVRNKRPDILFCYLLSEELKRETIAQITRSTTTKTFNWFADDHWRVPVFSRYWAPLFTLVSTTDSQAIKKYKAYGINNVIKTQWGANQWLYKPVHQASPNAQLNDLAISFVGKKFGKRQDYVGYLLQEGLAVRAFGSGWPLGRVSLEELIAIFSQSKINLNFSQTHYAGKFIWLKMLAKLFIAKNHDGYSFVGHNLISNFRSMLGSQKRPIKGRVFEVPACGGLLLTEQSDDDISEYYRPGKEVVVFKNTFELVEKCRYYLGHEQERKAIAQAGYERTLKDHTYDKRFKEIFNALL